MKKHHYCLCRINGYWQLAIEKSIGYTEIAVQPELLANNGVPGKPIVTFARGDSDYIQLNVSERAKALVRARTYLEKHYTQRGIDINSILTIPDEIRNAQ